MGPAGIGAMIVDDLPPAASHGQLWWESDTGNLYVRYNDGTSTQWVQIGGGGGLGGTSIADVTPSGATPGQLWWESDTGYLYVFYDDGTSSQWVQVATPEPIVGVITDAQHGDRGGGSLHALATDSVAGFFLDAPSNGSQYARKDGAWAVVTGGGGGGSMTGAEILAALITVDGAGSALDADLLDAQSGSWYLDRANHTGSQAQSTVTNLTSDLALKAALASPTFTGVPAAPTAALHNNGTQLATTAFVVAEIASGGFATTASLGTAAAKNIHVGTTAPGSPAVNDLWVDTT